MKQVTGGSIPAHIFRTYMIAAHNGLPQTDLPGFKETEPEPLPVAADDGEPADEDAASEEHPGQASNEEAPGNQEPSEDGLGSFIQTIENLLAGHPQDQ